MKISIIIESMLFSIDKVGGNRYYYFQLYIIYEL